MDAALRDDAAQDAYLAEIEGRLKATSFKTELKKIANSNYKRFQSHWGDRSLDEAVFDDSGEKYVDRLEDPSAMEAFDLIGTADEWE